MKYKAGDKVAIRTWKDMEREYVKEGGDSFDILLCRRGYTSRMEEELLKINSNRVLTIKAVDNICGKYEMEEMEEREYVWDDEMIKGLYVEGSEQVEFEEVSRFSLIDFD